MHNFHFCEKPLLVQGFLFHGKLLWVRGNFSAICQSKKGGNAAFSCGGDFKF